MKNNHSQHINTLFEAKQVTLITVNEDFAVDENGDIQVVPPYSTMYVYDQNERCFLGAIDTSKMPNRYVPKK